MSKLSWGDPSSRLYESGLDRGVLYPPDVPGVPWNGLISVNSTEVVLSSEKRYYDGYLYADVLRVDSFSATVEAYTYPDELDRESETFGLSYRTRIGEDCYILHLVYQAVFGVSDRAVATIEDTPSAATMSWDLATVPIKVPGERPTAHVTVDTRHAHPNLVLEIEDILYGNEVNESRLPSLDEILALFEQYAVLKITDNGDGTWTAEGPDEIITMLSPTSFEIVSPGARYLNSDTYLIRSH